MAEIKARMHTAEHIMFAILRKHYPTLISASLNLGEEKSRYSYRLSGKTISESELSQIESEINDKIKEGIKTEIRFATRKEAEKICTPDLFRLVPKDQEEIRLLVIGDFNTEACIGEHVKNTKEIGAFKFLKHEKIGKDTYRLDFTVNETKGTETKPMSNKPLAARMESAQHILHHILLHDYSAHQTGMQISDNHIRLDVKCDNDLTKVSKDELEEKVNLIIKKNLPVDKKIYARKDAPKDIDISMIPASVKEVRIVSIGDFDIQPCGNAHVDNTSEIGTYKINEIKRKGSNVYGVEGVVSGNDNIKQSDFSSPSGKFELSLAKGVRDFPPEEKIVRQNVIQALMEVFETYGYNPLETPQIERLDVLMAKFGAGEGSDAAKEIFKLRDQGERELGLRFDLTLPLCRYIAMNPTTKMPFKRYEIGRVYRDGPIKLGRYREFWQCDVDIVGTKSMLADAEVLAIAKDAFKKLNFEIIIEVSNRKLLNGILEAANVPGELRMPAMISIDKLKKIGIESVSKELMENGISQESIKKINEILNLKGKNNSKLSKLRKLVTNAVGTEGLNELEEMFSFLEAFEVVVEFNPALARGLTYYTGPIYEVFLKNSKVTGSVIGGGRYDEFIGNFLGKTTQIPATGLSFGIEPITEAIKLRDEITTKSVCKVYVIPIKAHKEALPIVQKLRHAGIKADIDVSIRGISKNLDYANTLGIPYVLFVGEDELKSGKYKLRDMKSGEEKNLEIIEIIKLLS
ncbi:MAG: histidine--tRNA ligase [archaeon]